MLVDPLSPERWFKEGTVMNMAEQLKKISKRTFSREKPAHHSQPVGMVTGPWLEQLPLTHVEKSTQLLLDRGAKTLWSRIPHKERFDILTRLQGVVEYLCYMHYQQAMGLAVVSSANAQTAVNWSLQLRVLMACASTTTLNKPFLACDEITRAENAQYFYWGLANLEAACVSCYQFNYPIPNNTWEKINAIAQFAFESGLDSIPVESLSTKEYAPSTINALYKRILMLSLAQPDQIPSGNIAILKNCLTTWVAFVDLGLSPQKTGPFCVDMNKDSPPARVLDETKNDEKKGHFFLQTEKLINRLASSAEVDTAELPAGLVEHCLGSWAKTNLRRHQRTKGKGYLNACVGLSSIHYFLSESKGHKNITLPGLNHIPQSFIIGTDSIEAFNGPGETSYPTTHGFYARPEKNQWALVDSSEGGYCLKKQQDSSHEIRTGDLIALQDPKTENAPWQIGVVRWHRNTADNELQIGIQRLAPTADPCAVQVRHKNGSKSQYLRGLLLPELSQGTQPATIILPALPYRSDDEFHVINELEDLIIHLKKRLDCSEQYRHFIYGPSA